MFILPVLAGLLFLLILSLKLLGGAISWWVIITVGVVLWVPLLLLIGLDLANRLRK